ncbi:PREDICTED: heat shock factor protein 1 isoform X2 [Trachymyrmex septentrionalis]|uniref:heat shock factor protein 1 isoform X2 n=1 Tax=Trachymyrmex septentrionalis TaxID=34720 RepID=UPI00084EDA1F|nr:PREDICTED: heat shock factor protein 1 isoform X2 [Trachymyrmex septentrionalis]
MRTTSNLGANVPAFLAKLWKMVEDPDTNNLISWSPSGNTFLIKNQSVFTSKLLPHYYKHNNMASFIRQLNMYGFHKIASVELGGLKCDKDEIEFAHQYFCKGSPHLVENIKRKVTANKNQDLLHSSFKPEVVDRMLIEVREMKERQKTMTDALNEMKLENSSLWTELMILRQKHLQQQEIINRLIQLILLTLVQPSRSGLSVKRRYPLMIHDTSCLNKRRKLSKSQESPTGPVIHELDASEPDVDSDYIADILKNENLTVQSPQEHNETLTDEENMGIIHTSETVENVPSERTVQNPEIETKRKLVCKDKKKKNKVPIKIVIPLENGKQSREILHMFEVSTDEDEPVSLLKNDSIGSNNVGSDDLENYGLTMEVLNNNPSTVKLENIITPEMLTSSEMIHNNNNIQNNIENEEDSSNPNNMYNKFNKNIDSGRAPILVSNGNEYFVNRIVQPQKEDNSYDTASASSSKDLLVSRVNSSGMTEANYRLESMEELNNHVETTQNNLDTFRDVLLSENCNLDANTLLDIFNTDDPMSFGLSLNSELNPYYGREEEDISDSVHGSAGGELMTYNPPLELDDMFMGTGSNVTDLQMNGYTHSMNYEDTKKLLDVLIANNTNSVS